MHNVETLKKLDYIRHIHLDRWPIGNASGSIFQARQELLWLSFCCAFVVFTFYLIKDSMCDEVLPFLL